jgi:hypothetical protein
VTQTRSITPTTNAVELAVVQGDLSKLSADQRLEYYRRTCESLGLNPLTQPFAYLTLNGKLTLYARKDCADQLRRVHGVSIDAPRIEMHDDWIVVTVVARDSHGRTDSDIGVVNKKDMRGDYGNALMKAVTKSKRRVTLSICGLGMLDETEVETIPAARVDPAPEAITDGPPPVEAHAKAVEEAETLDELGAAWKAVNKDGRLTPDQKIDLAKLKDERKAVLSRPAPSPEDSDPEPTDAELFPHGANAGGKGEPARGPNGGRA